MVAALAAWGDHVLSGQAAYKPSFAMPPEACDCHTHIFGEPSQFPMSETRAYTPPVALPEELLRLHKALGIERVVIVTPSVYGTRNEATLFGIRAYGKGARGVAVIDASTPERQLAELDKGGIRGIRINAATAGEGDPEAIAQQFQTLAARIRPLSWHVQFLTTPKAIAGLRRVVEDSPVLVVFDHFGGARASLGPEQPGFADLVSLISSGKAYVKISGAYRASSQSPNYEDVTPLAQALIAANPDRVLWGTDWPHPDSSKHTGASPEISPFLAIDDGLLLNQLGRWAPGADVRQKILVDNPARLYGF